MAPELFGLDGRVAVVTGGYGGIGGAVCGGIAAGGRVAISGHHEEKATACAEELRRRAPTPGRPFRCAVRHRHPAHDRRGRRALRAPRHPGQTSAAASEEKADEVTEEDFDHVITNLKSVMFQAQAAAKHMIAGRRRQGAVLRIGPGQLALRGRGFAAYCAAKGGLRQSAGSSRPSGRHKNQRERGRADIHPYRAGRQVARRSGVLQESRRPHPDGTHRRDRDVAAAALFFVSPASDFVTGQTCTSTAASRRRSRQEAGDRKQKTEDRRQKTEEEEKGDRR